MNQAKRGQILYKDMMQAARNAEYMQSHLDPKDTDKEEDFLVVLVQKAQSRLAQIQEDKK